MSTTQAVELPNQRPITQRRWVQVTLITVAIIAAANLQYCWTLFAKPLADGYGVSRDIVKTCG